MQPETASEGANGEPTPEPSLEAEQLTRDLANELMSPYCPGRTIASCTSSNARKLEDFILEQAEEGKSKEEIEQILVEEFGREKLGTVRSPHVVWTGSAIALLAAIVIGVWARRRLVASRRHEPQFAAAASGPAAAGGVSSATAAEAPSQAELDRLEDALADIREF